jgi:phytoene synthase
MQDVFAYCAELVRAADRDRFIAALFAPTEQRDALYALYAFNIELARVREVAREPLPGEIRLQWWSEVLNGERAEEARANPVACAILAVVERYALAPDKLSALVDARRFDLYDEPMALVSDLEAYARTTSSALMACGAQILAGTEAPELAGPAGIAYAIAGLLRAFPLHAARRQLYLPVELLDHHGVEPQDIFAGRSSAGLHAAVADLCAAARRHLGVARAHVMALPREALPAFLAVAPVRLLLDRLERSDPFAPADIPPWRRQWLIWRAARNPARIAA